MAGQSMHRLSLTWPLHAQTTELTGQPGNGEHRRMKTAARHASRAQAAALANVYGEGLHADIGGGNVGAAQWRTSAVFSCCWPTLLPGWSHRKCSAKSWAVHSFMTRAGLMDARLSMAPAKWAGSLASTPKGRPSMRTSAAGAANRPRIRCAPPGWRRPCGAARPARNRCGWPRRRGVTRPAPAPPCAPAQRGRRRTGKR